MRRHSLVWFLAFFAGAAACSSSNDVDPASGTALIHGRGHGTFGRGATDAGADARDAQVSSDGGTSSQGDAGNPTAGGACPGSGPFALAFPGPAACSSTPTGSGVVRHVATNGSDGADGSAAHPLASLGHALSLANPGDVIMLEDGVYREGIETSKGATATNPISIVAAAGAHPVISGSALVGSWTPASGAPSGTYVVNWNASSTPSGYSGPESPPRGAPQSVYVDGQALQQIGISAGAPVPGCNSGSGVGPCREVVGSSLGDLATHDNAFYFDENASKLYVRLANNADPNSHSVEVPQQRRVLFFYPGATGHICMEGLTFRHSNTSANAAQMSAITIPASSTLSNSIVEQMDLAGASPMDGATISHSIFRQNGQLGLNSIALNVTISASDFHGNNWRNFNPYWEAGGVKWSAAATGTVDGSHVYDNNGPGIWLDHASGDASSATISGNWLSGNGREGQIMIEVSPHVRVVNNVVWNDGRIVDPNIRGIYISESSDALVLFNTVVATAPSMFFDASSGSRGTAEGLVLSGNVFADIGASAPPNPRVRLAALSSWTSDQNLYFANTGSIGFQLGGSSAPTLAAWQSLSSRDKNSIGSDPKFQNGATSDVRLAPGSPAIDAIATSNAGVTTDVMGRSRPAGAGFDMGAVEACSP